MKVCIISEGSYPYVTGGVSSWIHQLIRNMPEITFEILSVMPKKEETLVIHYKLPENVANITTFFLDDYLDLTPTKRQREPKIPLLSQKDIHHFFDFEKTVNWNKIARIINDPKYLGNAVEFLQSEYFWNMIIKKYHQGYETESVNQYFWTLRSMYLPLVHLLQKDLPEADVYHSVSTGYAGLLGLMAKVIYEKPYILTEHGVYAREREEEILKANWVKGVYKQVWIKYFYFLSVGAYRIADKVISLYGRNKEIQLELGSTMDKTMVIPNGIDPQKYSVTRTLGDEKILLAVLRIVPIKDVKTMLRAFKIVVNHMDNVRLYLLGPMVEDDIYYRECIELTMTLGLQNQVEFLGKKNVVDYYKIADVMVLTSLSEGQPLVMLEGMAAGIPMVVSDVGSCSELVYGIGNDPFGACGIVTKPVSPVETAEAILSILNQPKTAEEMSYAGMQRVNKYYLQDQLISDYQKMYVDLGGE